MVPATRIPSRAVRGDRNANGPTQINSFAVGRAIPPTVVLLGDPRVAEIPIAECGEPFSDVRCIDAIVLRPRDDPSAAFVHVRACVAERLATAAQHLPKGTRLEFVEGYRPPQLQERFFDEYSSRLRTLHGDLGDEELTLLASRFVAPPAVAPHPTGGAVDVTLCRADGEELDMGTRVNASPEETRLACYTDAAVRPAARRNRAVLVAALTRAGFVNYPPEWWHWSYGDRYWALATGAPAAPYGAMAPDELDVR